MIFNKVFVVLFLFMFPLTIYSQELLSLEQENEIRNSGNYYSSNCAAFDKTDAVECALWELTKIVQNEMIKQSVSINETVLSQVIKENAQTAQLNHSESLTMLVWIQKVEIAKHLESYITSEPVPKPTQLHTITESIPKSKIDVPVVHDLATCETYEQFRLIANGYERNGKLVYGTNKKSFFHPEKCFIAVFSSTKKIIALLDIGKDNRKNLLNGEVVQNPELHYSKNILVWIQINN